MSDGVLEGMHPMGADVATRLQLSYNNTVVLDASSADAESPAGFLKCRAISVDTAGIIKVDYTDDGGVAVTEVMRILAGLPRPVRNVTKLYRYYVGTTAGTAKAFNSAGTEVTNAVKLHK